MLILWLTRGSIGPRVYSNQYSYDGGLVRVAICGDPAGINREARP